MKDIIKEVYELYAAKAGENSQYSFYSWLDAMGIEPTTEAWKDILKHPENYEF